MSLAFITSNKNKQDIASKFLAPFNINLEFVSLDIDEIQSDDFEKISKQKAISAFALYKKPLFISDHSWTITALNGFPGPYMHYINEWLTADDLLRLMDGIENREIILHDSLCFIDENGPVSFKETHTGYILKEKQGNALPAQEIICLTNDDISIAKKLKNNPSVLEDSSLYKKFGEWITKNKPELLKA